MRIAYVTETYPPELNGVSLTVERTVQHLRAQGHDVDLLRPCQQGESRSESAGEWRSTGCPIPVYPDLQFGLAWPSALKARFAQSQAQLVHVATPGPLGWASIAAARAMGLALTSDFRTNFHQYSGYYGMGFIAPWVQAGLRHFHNQTQCTFVPTQTVRKELKKAGFERLEVVGRGVDTEQFSPQHRSSALRERWCTKEGPVLLYVGRLAAEKNLGLALKAFAEVKAIEPSAQMVVVGDGPLRSRLEARHTDVHFAGVQRGERLAQHYASSDIFLFPSLSDTFGNVTLEALASGLAVVAYDTAAAAEHVQHGICGMLAPPGDEATFIRNSCLLAQWSRYRVPMRKHACAAAAQARWDSVLGKFENHLLETQHAHENLASQLACSCAV